MHGTWKKVLAPAVAVAVSALSLGATALPAYASSAKPTYIIAYEGPLSGGNAQLGLNMEYSVELAINQANSGTSTFGSLPFTLQFKAADDQGSPTVSPTTAAGTVTRGGPSEMRMVTVEPSGAWPVGDQLMTSPLWTPVVVYSSEHTPTSPTACKVVVAPVHVCPVSEAMLSIGGPADTATVTVEP